MSTSFLFTLCLLLLSCWCKWVHLQNFCEYKMWLAAENGIFLRSTTGKWMTKLPENLNLDWIDRIKVFKEGLHLFPTSVCIVFLYFLSNKSTACLWVFHWKNATITVWSQKCFTCMELQVCRYIIWLILYPSSWILASFQIICTIFQNLTMIADVKFGRVQAIDLLQHLCAGLSKARFDVIQGSCLVEVRAVGVTKVIWLNDKLEMKQVLAS